MTAPAGQQWMHAYTYSGHATCCAVAVANIELLEKLELANRAKKMGARLLKGLEELYELDCVGNVRGLGLMCAVELVADKETKETANIAGAVLKECQKRGLISRIKGESLLFAPPLIITEEEVDQIVSILRESIISVWSNQ